MTRRYPEKVIITDEVYAQLSSKMQALSRRIDRVKVKGKTEEITIYGVTTPEPSSNF